MAGKYVITTRKDGRFQFVLEAGNGLTILASQGYAAKQGAENGIASVRRNGADEANFDRLTAADGRPYFTLKAENGQVIGTSQMYADESGRSTGIASVVTHASDAEVDDRSG